MDQGRRCMSCMSSMGEFSVCPECGWIPGTEKNDTYQLSIGTVLQNRYQVGMVKVTEPSTITYCAWDTLRMKRVELREYYPAAFARRAPGIPNVIMYKDDERRHRFEEGRKGFLAVSKALRKISPCHGVVTVLDCFEANYTAYAVTEYLDGISLGAFVKQSFTKMTAADALNIARPLCMALDYLHKKGIIIRNLNPESIVLTVDNRIKIANFDAAVVSGNKTTSIISPELYNGYTAPEFGARKGKITERSDIYSLCSVLYYALTGKNVTEQEITGGEGDIYSPASNGVLISEHMDLAIMKGLAVEPSLRFKSGRALFDALSGKVLVKPVSRLRKSSNRKKTAGIISAAMLTALLASLFFVYGVVYGGIMDDEIDIWLPEFEDRDMSRCMHQLFEVDESEKNSVCAAFLEEHSNVELNIQWIKASEYEQTLIAAGENDSLPELFYCPDMLPQLEDKIKDVSLIIDKLVRKGNYSLLERYAEIFPDSRYIPSAVDSAVLYYNTALVRENGIEVPEKAGVDEYISLLGGDDDSTSRLKVKEDFRFVLDADHNDGNIIIPEDRHHLLAYSGEVERTYPQQLMSDESPDENYVYGSEELYGFVGSVSELNWVQKALPGYYGVGCIVDAPISFTAFFCISDSTYNKEKIAEDIVLRLYDSGTQVTLNISGSGYLPVEDTALTEYSFIYTDFDFIEEYLSSADILGEEWYEFKRENIRG